MRFTKWNWTQGPLALGAVVLASTLAAGSTARADWVGDMAAAAARSGAWAVTAANEAPRDSHGGWLGVYTQRLTEDLRSGIDYTGDGVLVNRVAEDSPADRAGLKSGDVLVKFAGTAVRSPEDLLERVRSQRAGSRVELEYVRDGHHQTATATLGERPAPAADEEDSDRRVVIRELRDAPRMGRMNLPNVEEMPELEGLLNPGRGRLGVMLQELNNDLGSYFSVPDGKGVLIVEVVEDSPASRAGLRAGDVLLRIGDTAVDNSEDVVRAVQRSGGKLALTLMRHGQRQTLSAELPESSHSHNMRWFTAPTPPTAPVPPEGDGGPGMRMQRRDRSELRRDVDQLREEIRQLREQLREKDKDKDKD